MGLSLGHTASSAKLGPLPLGMLQEQKENVQDILLVLSAQFHRPDSGNSSLVMELCGPEIAYTHREFTHLL